MSETLPIITYLEEITDFGKVIAKNPGLVIVKFGAKWCGPCKQIDPLVHDYIHIMPPEVQSLVIDIDECPKIYKYFVNKRMVNGVPVILAWYKGNTKYIPDDFVVGANPKELVAFFERCMKVCREIQ